MPLTKEHVTQIYKLDTRKVKEGKRYLHGVTSGMDNVMEATIGVPITHDYSTYHAVIIDIQEDENLPLKSMLLQIEEVINKAIMFRSHNPLEIEKFINEHLDPDFKFS